MGKGGLTKSKKDFCSKHDDQEVAAQTRVEQHPTEKHVGGRLHLQDQGDLRCIGVHQHVGG